MCGANQVKARRAAAGAMGLLMLLIVLFSAFCIAAEADHECTGEDCRICACILRCENTLRGTGDGKSTQLPGVVPVLCVLLFAVLFSAELLQETLVNGKVRLND